MNNTILQELERKADNWKVDSLKQEVDHLKSENRLLMENFNYAKQRIDNQYRAIETIIRVESNSD